MPQPSIDLVTVSREYGAGGSDFAKKLGERLGWPVLDYGIIGLVAERLNLREGVVRRRDEQSPGWLERIASTLLIAPPESTMQVETSGVMTPDSIAMAAQAVISETAESPPVIIVGHGAQYIFRDRPGTVQIRLTGTIESRVRRIVARDGGTDAEAAASAHRIDAQRHAYVQRYYHHLWTDPTMFDAQFNTARVTIDEAVRLTAALIESRNGSDVNTFTSQEK
ncbi:MAG: cytidylate kinase-like family protein [Gemmatimonadaceae bacterium]